MCTSYSTLSRFTYRIALLFLGAGLLGGCSRSRQLGMEDNPEEILESKLNNPEAILTPNQSITLLNYCAELGERNAAHAAGKTVSIFAGNIGSGKSTTLNALLGCQMRAVRPRELGLPGMKRVVVVAPESPCEEVTPIGHGRRSRTFMPQIAQDLDHPNRAYCDCPGFYNTMGAEINIANAINIRKILQQATGVKVVFLAEYDALLGSRGRGIRNLEAMCGKMFDGTDNLRKYQNSVLLGITKAPLYEEDELLTTNAVQKRLKLVGSDVAAILANRVFLFDPLDRATDNLDFWDRDQLRTVIGQLRHIPQQQAVHLFQTTLTDSDKVHLLTTVRQLHSQIVSTITQGDVTALGQHWQLLQRLRVVEHPEVDQLIEGQVFPAVNTAIFQKAEEVKSSASAFDFDDAQRKLSALTDIVRQIPGVPLLCNVNALRRHVHNCQANKDNKEAFKERLAALREELEEVKRRLALAREQEQLSMQDDPQEILNNKLRDPETVLTPSQSITLLNHCTELGEKNAETAIAKTVSIFVGNTGTGKSTTINALLGCQMRAVRPRELGLPGIKSRVVVASESLREEVMPIGHGGQSQTFLPQVVQTTDEPNSAYCDCPGFYDTRGAEINIANAINIRKILQQATGVKAVFLAEYDELTADRGRFIQNLETMCRAMFGGVDNLRKYQNSVLLGITKAPLYEEDELLTTNAVRGQLLMGVNSDVATILADRIFLFDPLDRAIDNPDFWPVERFRTEIAQLEYIPQQQAVHLFQTTLTDSDKVHLLTTVRQLHAQIASAITQGDVTALGQHWQLLQRLRIIEHPEVHELIEGQVLPYINIAILQKANAVRSSANVLDFEDARRQLSELISIIGHLPGVPLACDINAIQKHIHDCEANKNNAEAFKAYMDALKKELADAKERIAFAQEQLRRVKRKQNVKLIFGDLLGAVGYITLGPLGGLVGCAAGNFLAHTIID